MKNTVQVLNQLLAIHGSSLPRYLMSAPPFRQFGDEKAWDVIRQINEDQQIMIDKIADYVESLEGTPTLGEFPPEYTGYHDLSLDYIMGQVITGQRREVALMEQLSEMLELGTQAKALAQEALGAAKGHLQSLEETLAVLS